MLVIRRLMLTMASVLLITQPGVAWAGLGTIARGPAMLTSAGRWSAVVTQPGLSGTVGSPQTIQWNGASTLPSPIGQVDHWDTVDLLSTSNVDLIAEQFVFTLSGTDANARSWGIWLCANGTWTIAKTGTCSSGQVYGTTSSVSGNGRHTMQLGWRVVPSGRLHLALTIGHGDGKPPGTATIGVEIISPTHLDTTTRYE